MEGRNGDECGSSGTAVSSVFFNEIGTDCGGWKRPLPAVFLGYLELAVETCTQRTELSQER
jgi:hypothetical protein